jgi:toxin-antitoxin system PIN domain toxin
VIVPDVNLLLYANITAFPLHEQARTWWEETVNSTDTIGLTAPAIFGFLRIATSARVFESPMAIDAAAGTVRSWLAQPNIILLAQGPEHLDIALRLLSGVGTAGNLTTDVQLAAYAIEHRAELHSNDTDFGRFPELDWVNPLSTTAR